MGNVGPKAAFFVVLIALSFMVGVVWKLYVGGSSPDGQEVPIVRADDNPFKVSPDDPGGMDIPHKDSTIFSSLNNDREEGGVENLLADDDEEEPMPRSQLFAGLNTDADVEADMEEEPSEAELGTGVEEDQERLEQMTEDAEAIFEEVMDEGVEAIVPAPTEELQEEVVTEEPTSKPVSKPLVLNPQATTGDYYVQVGSVKSAEGAEAEWKKYTSKYNMLSDFSHRIEEADLGTKGIYYRIQAGPMSKEQAASTCNSIKKIDPAGCLLKKD